MEGRFISKDPISFAGGDVNLYGYTWNNPVTLVDPSGLWGVLAGAGAGGGTITAGGSAGAVSTTVTGGAAATAAGVGIAVTGLILGTPTAIGDEPDINSPAFKKGNQDPQWVRDLPNAFNPGKFPNGQCKPCPEPQSFSHPDQQTHPCQGHQISWNQDPVTCMCYKVRK